MTPYTQATPTQIDLHRARTARLARMGINRPAIPRLTGTSPASVPVVAYTPPPPPEPVPEPVAPISQQPWERVAIEVCRKHRLTQKVLFGRARYREVVTARHEYAFRLLVELGFTYPAIGRRMKRDHTTILSGVRRHIACNPDAAIVYAKWNADNEAKRAAMVRESIRLHFEDGVCFSHIGQQFGVTHGTIATLIYEAMRNGEAERYLEAAE